MSSAQSWALIGVFATALFAMNGLVLWIVRSEISAVHGRVDGFRNEIVARLDALDRDVQRLYEHVFRREV